MQAAVWHGAGDIRVTQLSDLARPRPGEALVRIAVSCICGSDVAEYKDGPHVIPTSKPHPLTGRVAPLTLGHEYCGRVVAVGEGVTNCVIGDRVCGDSCIRCNECFWCLRGEYNICARGASVGFHSDGSFASLLQVPAYCLYPVPDSVSDEAAAVVEPLAVGLHSLKRGRLGVGDSVVVIGCGMIGAGVAMLARASGASFVAVVDPAANRRETALAVGAVEAFDPTRDNVRQEVRARTEGRGADLVVDCTGSAAAMGPALELCRRGGRLAVCGIGHGTAQLSEEKLVYFEREIIGVLGYQFDHSAILQLLASGRIVTGPFLGAPIDLNDIVRFGFDLIVNDPASPLRIPVIPPR